MDFTIFATISFIIGFGLTIFALICWQQDHQNNNSRAFIALSIGLGLMLIGGLILIAQCTPVVYSLI